MAGSSSFFEDPSVWTAAAFPLARGWARELDRDQLAEIDDAIRRVDVAGIAFDRITKAAFPLPLTEPLLEACRRDLEWGCGFGVIAGFPVERYSRHESLLAFAGLSAYLGRIVDQSYAGAMIVDVKDTGLGYSAQSRGYQSNAMLRFHTDGACLTGLMCLGVAAEGGRSVLVSSGAVHNAVLAERPDLYEILKRGFHHHRRGEHGPDEPPISPAPIPVFSHQGGLLHCVYDRNQSLWAAECGVVISADQLEALDFLDSVIARPELQLDMELRLGDIQYVNNFTVLHARTAYRDAPGRQRHLLRIWLDTPGSRWGGFTARDLYVSAPNRARRA